MQGHQVSSNEQLEISKKKKEALNLEDRTNPMLDNPVISNAEWVQHCDPGFRFLTWNDSLPPPALLGCQEITSVSSLVALSRKLTSGKGKQATLDCERSCVSHTQTMADIWMVEPWQISRDQAQEARLIREKQNLFFKTCKISKRHHDRERSWPSGDCLVCLRTLKGSCLVYFRTLSIKSLAFHLTMSSPLCQLKMPTNSRQVTDGGQSWPFVKGHRSRYLLLINHFLKYQSKWQIPSECSHQTYVNGEANQQRKRCQTLSNLVTPVSSKVLPYLGVLISVLQERKMLLLEMYTVGKQSGPIAE